MDAAAPLPHDFHDLLGFLSAWLAWRRTREPGYSFRDFAREAGEQNQTILHAILTGSRRCTPGMMARWQHLLAEREPDRALLVAMAMAEEAHATWTRRQAWTRRRETEDAAAQEALALARWREAADEVALCRAVAWNSRRAEGRGEEGELAQVGLSALDRRPEALHAWLVRGEEALMDAPAPTLRPRAVYALTEGTGPALRARLVGELARFRDALLAREPRGARRFHVQVALFPLSVVATETPVSADAPVQDDAPAADAPVAPSPPATEAPDLYAWGLPGDGGAPAFLDAWLRWRRAEDPAYSFAVFSRDADQPDRGILWKIIRHKQRLTPMRALQFALGDGSPERPGMGLTDAEGRYLALLAERDGARGAAQERLQQRLDQERALAAAMRVPLHRVQRFADPLPWTLIELRTLAAWRPDPAWIAAQLWPPEDLARVETTLAELERVGLDAVVQGSLEFEFTQSKGDPRSSPITRYHQAMKARASAVFAPEAPLPPGPRSAFALTISVSEDEIDALHAQIEALARSLQALCAGDSEPRDQVMQINLHGWEM